MNDQEVNALLTEVSQVDNFVKNTDQEFEVWKFALAGVDYTLAREVTIRFHAEKEPGGPSITPGYIRRAVAREVERAAVKRAALERGPDVHYRRQVNTWRARNPEMWDELVRAGTHEQWDAWRRQGETDQPCGCGCGSRPSHAP